MAPPAHSPYPVRPALAADLPGIAAIYDREVREGTATFDTVPRSGPEWADWLTAHPADRFPVIVAAAADGEVAGWASLSPWSTRLGYAGTVEASVFVAPDRQGQGLGRRLCDAMLGTARHCGHRVVLGRIEASNGASLRLFETCGFRTVGTMHGVGLKFGRELDVVLVERRV